MGKQINFLMDLELEQEFFKKLKSEGIVLHQGQYGNPTEVDVLPVPFADYAWFSLYLYRSHLGELCLRTPLEGTNRIDFICSPVIEFTRTLIDPDTKKVMFGRLWVEMKYWNESGELVEKPKELNDWYSSLCKWIKKNAPKTEFHYKGKVRKEYMTSAVVELIEKEGYQL